MSLEDQVKFHEQMILSIESNLDKVTDDLAHLTEVVRTLGDMMITLAERQDQSVARIERLEDLFERWLRNQTNGQN